MELRDTTPTDAILTEMGERLTQVRKQQGFSQEALAEAAGVGVATVRRIEDGRDGQLGSWIKLLKALRMTAALDELLPPNFESPMAEALGTGARRRRRREGSAEGSQGATFQWGDEVQ